MAKAPTKEMDFFEKIGYAFSLWNESWEALKLNIWTFVILYVLPLGLAMVLGLFYLAPLINDAAGNETLTAASAIVAFVATLVIVFIYVVLYPVLTMTQLESAKGNKVALGDMFNRGIKYLPAYIVLALMVAGAVVVPFIVAILLIPFIIGIFLLPVVFVWAVIVSVFILLVPYIIINDNLNAVEAVKKGIAIVKVKWQWVLAVYAVFMLISVVAGFIPFIGTIVSLVFSAIYFCMPAIVYLRHIADTPVIQKSEENVAKPAMKKQVTKKKPATKK